MDGRKLEPAVEAPDRLASRRLEPAGYFCGVTLIGALITAAATDVAGTTFFMLTVIALLILRRFELSTGFELAFAIGIVLQGWGNALVLFESIGWYDKAVHFLTPILVVPSLYLLLARAGALPPLRASGLRRGMLGVFVVTTALGIALAAIWEVIEGSADRWLGTNLAYGYLETIDDLYSSVLGSVAVGALLAWLVAAGRDLAGERAAVGPLPESE